MHWFTSSVTITITSQIMDYQSMNHKQIEVEVHRQKLKKNKAEDLALSKDRRPAEKVSFDKTLASLPLKMFILLPNKDFIPLTH